MYMYIHVFSPSLPPSLFLSLSLSPKAATAHVYLLVSQSATDSIIEGSLLFLLRHPQYSRTQWQLIKGSYESYLVSLSETRRREIQKLFIDCCIEWIKVHKHFIVILYLREGGIVAVLTGSGQSW